MRHHIYAEVFFWIILTGFTSSAEAKLMQPMITIRASRIESIFFIQKSIPFVVWACFALYLWKRRLCYTARVHDSQHFQGKTPNKKASAFSKKADAQKAYTTKKYNKQGTIQAHRASRFLRKLCTKAFSRFPGLRIIARLRLLMPCGTMDLSSISPRSQWPDRLRTRTWFPFTPA